MTGDGPVGDRIRAQGITVRELKMAHGVPNPIAIARLATMFRADHVSAVQTWLYHADLVGGLAGQMARVPVAWGIHHGALDPEYTSRRLRLTVRLAARLSGWIPARIVCCSQASRDTHVGLGYDPARMLVIPNGFDLCAFQPNLEARAHFRAELGLDELAIAIGMIGRFVPLKNHRLFIDAAKTVSERCSSVHFVMAGTGVDRDDADLAGWIGQTGLQDRFHLLGQRADMPALMAGLDLLAMPSRVEAFPMVIGEAMASGAPCIATDVGDAALVIGQTGRIVPPGNAPALAGAMIELATLPPPARKSLGITARERIADLYDIESIATRYADLWLDLAQNSKSCE
jgi:glycosyltransferase involved in cell wall biosynthesis